MVFKCSLFYIKKDLHREPAAVKVLLSLWKIFCEEVFGPGAEHFFGRMHSVEITARLAREEFEIPMWIWCSHRYMVRHPEIAHAVVTSRNRRFMIDALPHVLLYLGGIHTKDYRPEMNVLGNEYNEMRPRLLKATTDYDEIMKPEKSNE